MHKCPNCGQEFEGNFCSNCGERWQEEKACPECGAKLTGAARFCNQCGYSFYNRQNSETAVTAVKSKTLTLSFEQLLIKGYAVLKYVPVILFVLFAVLLFAFYAGSFAVMPAQEFFGEKIPAESYGSVYANGEMLNEIPEFKGAIIALILFAVLAVLYAVCYAAINLLPVTRYKKINRISTYGGFVFYFIFFITGCVVCGKISALDGGMGMIAAGACPVLLIVFSLIFMICGVGAILGRYFINKKYPAVAAEEEEKIKQIKENFIATVAAPVAPENVVIVNKPQLKNALIEEAEKLPDYRKRARKLRGYNLVVLHLTLFLLTLASMLYVVFLIPFGYHTTTTYKKSPEKIISKNTFIFAIIMSILCFMVGIILIILQLVTMPWVVDLILNDMVRLLTDTLTPIPLGFILYGTILLVFGLIGKMKTNKLTKYLYGVKNYKKETPTAEYGKNSIEIKKQYVILNSEYLEFKKVYSNYKKQYAEYRINNFLYRLSIDYNKIPNSLKRCMKIFVR